MKVLRYKKKPVIVKAIQWTGQNIDDVLKFSKTATYERTVSSGNFLIINTLEGRMTADVNDYIIKGVKGEFYPCKPDIFEMTYDVVEEQSK